MTSFYLITDEDTKLSLFKLMKLTSFKSDERIGTMENQALNTRINTTIISLKLAACWHSRSVHSLCIVSRVSNQPRLFFRSGKVKPSISSGETWLQLSTIIYIVRDLFYSSLQSELAVNQVKLIDQAL